MVCPLPPCQRLATINIEAIEFIVICPEEEIHVTQKCNHLFSALCFHYSRKRRPANPNSSAQAASSQANMANAAESAQIKRLASDDARSQQDDLRKMRVIVAQMEANLAFVDNTQSPLKHQFQLEIDMWKALLSNMERRAQANSR